MATTSMVTARPTEDEIVMRALAMRRRYSETAKSVVARRLVEIEEGVGTGVVERMGAIERMGTVKEENGKERRVQRAWGIESAGIMAYGLLVGFGLIETDTETLTRVNALMLDGRVQTGSLRLLERAAEEDRGGGGGFDGVQLAFVAVGGGVGALMGGGRQGEEDVSSSAVIVLLLRLVHRQAGMPVVVAWWLVMMWLYVVANALLLGADR
ncbi:hypothetical protein BJ742DRAFT_472784 [Cladochytrium replicatum]|nr:hypothetical protein BJ742DRAFT_472784 [Cladochytrium replicatum]